MNKIKYNKSIKKNIKKHTKIKIDELNNKLNASIELNTIFEEKLLYYEQILFNPVCMKTCVDKCIPYI